MAVPIRADLAGIPDYIIPGQPPGAILLNSNEGPLAPPPSLIEAITRAAAESHRYPTWFSDELVSRLADRLGVPEQWITVGCGSVSLCQQLIQAYCAPGDEIVCAWRSFEAYPVFARVAGVTARTVPLDPEHRHDLDAMLAAITPATRVVFVCNPNNPTGTVVRADALRRFLDEVPSDVLVVLDEAYREFLTDPDVPDGIPLALERENVAVLRTFSKAYALAGVRIGYCVAPPPIAAGTAKVGVPFAVSRLAQAAGLAALEHADEVGARCETVIRERERLSAAMREAGHDVPPSQANFLWLPLRERSARFGEHCAESGIMVRVFGKDGVRVTVGLPEENDAFLRAAQSFAHAVS
ncbi:histidinol-phosphate transaminase [Streptomyces caniferus]|uniref:Aromatic amino acid aminotransferase n=1 Tax=Streptomyces caniferus TaxID=285557 RepID=A0A640S850_9ACTN|nr:histidinol-phosphate transaminase [Streptomyces caniferus]GFE07238.1 putative phenylalanine aminotransferase [Streptomyces caniferus]